MEKERGVASRELEGAVLAASRSAGGGLRTRRELRDKVESAKAKKSALPDNGYLSGYLSELYRSVRCERAGPLLRRYGKRLREGLEAYASFLAARSEFAIADPAEMESSDYERVGRLDALAWLLGVPRVEHRGLVRRALRRAPGVSLTAGGD
jgi:hypothetical protein